MDACVLVPIGLTDLLLRLAEADTYRLLWTEEVLDEVERNLPKVGVDPVKAAVRGDAAVIVTANLRNFPEESLRPYDIDAVHPDEFLLDQLDLYPDQTVQCLHEQIAAMRRPRVTIVEFLDHFSGTVPRFSREAACHL